jgi:phytoene/squalene synthetase
VWHGESTSIAVLANLAPTLQRHRLDIAPFRALVEANRRDQSVCHYETWPDLRGYCTLSAEPVGRIVLQILRADTPLRRRHADGVCTALQVIEHCQDVAEDRARGRCYLPQHDLVRYAVEASDLAGPSTSANLRAVIKLEINRAGRLLLHRADFDVLGEQIRRERRDTLSHLVRLVAGRP